MDGEIQKIVAESGAGAFVNAGDSLGLAKAAQRLYHADERERGQMGENAKDYYYRHFERNMNMEKLVDFMFKEGSY
jgi:hypothetical protein